MQQECPGPPAAVQARQFPVLCSPGIQGCWWAGDELSLTGAWLGLGAREGVEGLRNEGMWEETQEMSAGPFPTSCQRLLGFLCHRTERRFEML